MGAERKTINWFRALSLNLNHKHKSNIFWHHVSRWWGSINKRKSSSLVLEQPDVSSLKAKRHQSLRTAAEVQLIIRGRKFLEHSRVFGRIQMLLYLEGARIYHGLKLWMCHMMHVRVLFKRKSIMWHCGFYWLVDVGSWDVQKWVKIRDKVWLESRKELGKTSCALVGKNRHRGNIVTTLKNAKVAVSISRHARDAKRAA